MTTDKVAIVTGAAAGIGAACALRLATKGIAIGVLDLDEERCADTLKAIADGGGGAVALAADVSNRQQVRAAVTKLRDTFGPVTIVVNNAGVTDFTPFEDVSEERFRFIYDVNVLGSIIVTQEVLSDMKAAKWGRVREHLLLERGDWVCGYGDLLVVEGRHRRADVHPGAGVGTVWDHGEQHSSRQHYGYDHVRGEYLAREGRVAVEDPASASSGSAR